MHQGLKRAPLALLLAAAVAASFAGVAAPARAQQQQEEAPPPPASADNAAPPSVARIAALDGQVAVKHGDNGEETAAAMNAPLMAGDYLTVGDGGRAEVQLDANTIVRLAAGTQLRFTQLDGQSDVAQIAQGQMELRVLQNDPDQVQVQTPSVDVAPSQPGAYLITVTGEGNTEVTTRSGSLAVMTPQGNEQVDPGRTMVVSGNASNPQYQYESEVALSDLEQWGDQRDQMLIADANQAPPNEQGGDIAGMPELNADGQWVDIPGYGQAWVPNNESPSWTPYSDGSWSYEPYYGYTWVAAEPWGWAPYHYGRWAYASPYGWAWVPGPIYGRPAWSPALVAFFGYGSGGTQFGVGFGNVGWVPLAPGEYSRPWWGPGARLSLGVSFSSYRNYSHGFIGVSYNTWQSGVIRNAHPLGASYLASAHFYGGTVPGGGGFATRASYRPMSGNFPRTNIARFQSIHPYGAAPRTMPSSSWQHFSVARGSYASPYGRSYAQPSYARSYAQPYNRSYAQPYNRSYSQPYNRSYAQPYNRSYAQPYNRSYAQPYNRSYAQPYNRSYAPQRSYGRSYSQPNYRGYPQSYGRGYQQSYGRSYQAQPRYSSGASRPSSGGARSHGPGRP